MKKTPVIASNREVKRLRARVEQVWDHLQQVLNTNKKQSFDGFAKVVSSYNRDISSPFTTSSMPLSFCIVSNLRMDLANVARDLEAVVEVLRFSDQARRLITSDTTPQSVKDIVDDVIRENSRRYD